MAVIRNLDKYRLNLGKDLLDLAGIKGNQVQLQVSDKKITIIEYSEAEPNQKLNPQKLHS